MRALVSSAAALRLDQETREAYALHPLILMENAAHGLMEALAPLAARFGAGEETPLVALVGKGSNGGDALALLRQARFAGLKRLGAILSESELGELGALHAASLRALGIPVLGWGEPGSAELLAEAGLLVDGIAGTGLRGELREPALELAKAAAASCKPIAAIDLPSGLGDRLGAEAFVLPCRWTLSIEPRKASLYYPAFRDCVGQIIPVNGVFPLDAAFETRAELLEEGELQELAPRIPLGAHKGQRGRLGIAAGSAGMFGAACLAARAASAAGAGLVYLYLPKELYAAFSTGAGAGAIGAAIVRPESSIGEEFDRLDAILAGPGWGRGPDRLPLLSAILDAELPLILDADALRLLPQLSERALSRRAPLLLCPHPGELESLSAKPAAESLADPIATLAEVSSRYSASLVLKSQVSWIHGVEGDLRVWDGREPSLATAGSGDVLAGLAAGILAGESARAKGRAIDVLRVLSAAVLAHGMAGRQARAVHGWYEASVLVEEAAKLLGVEHERG